MPVMGTETSSSVWDRIKGGEGVRGGPPALAGTREYGIGSRRRVVLTIMEFGISQRETCTFQ